jgi:hypothetical protein
MKKPTRVLCKRSLIIGDDYYMDEFFMPPLKVWRDNRMLVAGDWYDVVFNENDTDETFSIIDNQGHRHLHFMYGEAEDNNYNLPRTYAKWFYTPKELEKKQLRERNIK